MALEEYKKKRTFSKTTEPKGETKKTGLSRFVIQEHNASHLHYDFRLEFDGVLKSWAVPKEPPSESGIKRLAVEVEDHPVDYIDFEGEIPEGEYGGGVVKIWDSGTFDLTNRTENELEFELFGKKLAGNYVLIRTKMGGNPKNWLFFKKK